MMRVVTQSGSVYLLDNDAMTWQRDNRTPGHEHILFMEGTNAGRLTAPAEPVVGDRIVLQMGDEWVRTTPVVSIE